MIKITDWDKVVKWSYSLAKQFAVQELVPKGVFSARKFDKYKKEGGYLPGRFPKRPDDYFRHKGVWKGWPDFFDHPEEKGLHKKTNYYDYETASRITREAGIKFSGDYKKWKNRPERIPARPDQYYKVQWTGWQNFLGDNYKLPKPYVSAKLTSEDVRIIKHQLELGVPGSKLAKFFNVSEMQITRIKRGENWANVKVGILETEINE